MNAQLPRGAAWLVSGALALLAWAALHAWPASQEIGQLERARRALEADRAATLEGLARHASLRQALPTPSPDIGGWLSQNSLRGLEKQVDFNKPYADGRGAQVRLRRLQADQIARLFSELRGLDVVFDRFTLTDRDGDGRWDLEAWLEVPSP